MSKNIAISDDVYERLKREKGDRSFSEVIEDALDSGGGLTDVTGAGVLDEAALEDVDAEMRRLSEGVLEHRRDEAP